MIDQEDWKVQASLPPPIANELAQSSGIKVVGSIFSADILLVWYSFLKSSIWFSWTIGSKNILNCLLETICEGRELYDLRAFLLNHIYKEDIQNLERLLKKDLNFWN